MFRAKKGKKALQAVTAQDSFRELAEIRSAFCSLGGERWHTRQEHGEIKGQSMAVSLRVWSAIWGVPKNGALSPFLVVQAVEVLHVKLRNLDLTLCATQKPITENF